MRNKRLANVASFLENNDVTWGELNSFMDEVDEKHEESFKNLIVANWTSEKHYVADAERKSKEVVQDYINENYNLK